jgi:zinc/manganese transport system permease protein
VQAAAFLLPAFAACLVLTAIHVYLGNHVIARGVIFVDLALAQVAALGAMTAAVRGHEPGTFAAYLGSLGFALLGALVFALTGGRHRGERVPQEAIIGIVYAVSASAVVLLASKLTHGPQEIERMLVGNILWVTWPTVGKTALLYAALGLLHYLMRRPFLELTYDPRGAYARGRRARLLDFLFYASFALVITSSVAIAGVLLVFSFLVVPSVVAFLLADRLAARLYVGWAVSVLASLAGLAASWLWDLPTGAAVVTAFGVVLVAAAAGGAAVSALRAGRAVAGGGI